MWLRILGENEGHHVIFQAEKHGQRHEYLEKVKNGFFFLGILVTMRAPRGQEGTEKSIRHRVANSVTTDQEGAEWAGKIGI